MSIEQILNSLEFKYGKLPPQCRIDQAEIEQTDRDFVAWIKKMRPEIFSQYLVERDDG